MSPKQELRKRTLALRDSIKPEDKKDLDRRLTRNMSSVIVARNITELLIYVSFRSEADTSGIINMCFDKGICVYVPRVEDKEIRFYRILSADDLSAGYMGILEPAEGCIPWENPLGVDSPGTGNRSSDKEGRSNVIADPHHTMIIVPGAVFDTDGYRIGYGGGYYDRFLEANPDLFSAGICYDLQIVDHIPRDTWDERLDCIVNNEEIKYIQGS